LNNSRRVTDFGDGCVAFPTGNRRLMNADLVGNLLLEEFEVYATPADVVA
jgi:hypothetical protein